MTPKPTSFLAALVVSTTVATTVGVGGCGVTREVGARVFQGMTRLNPSSMERRSLPGGIESACSRGSITWVVPVDDGGVVLVDTGFDDQARAIKHVVGDRPIRAILLTHAHVDHAAGTAAIDAPVYVGRRDAPALRGEPTFTALYPHLGEGLAGIPKALGPIHEVDDGAVIVIGNRRFRAVATPGHTWGSVSWLLDDILFGGDAVQSPLGAGIYPAPIGFTVDMRVAYDSLRRLRDVDIAWLADAHYGVLPQPAKAIREALERDHSDVSRLEYPGLRPVGCGDDPPGT
jgi:glyoxylase-like metal-dependent hydrolase (beta-lactamase superfamily II)